MSVKNGSAAGEDGIAPGGGAGNSGFDAGVAGERMRASARGNKFVDEPAVSLANTRLLTEATMTDQPEKRTEAGVPAEPEAA